MAVFDGMRPGEIFAIRIGNISGESVLIDQRAYKGNIETPKGRKGKRTSRTVGLSPGTIGELKVWRMLLCGRHRRSDFRNFSDRIAKVSPGASFR